MPSRNVLKVDAPQSFYHVYAAGIGQQPIFLAHEDFEFFLQLFRRYLSGEVVVNSVGTPYEKLHDSVEFVQYCLMGGCFHLLLYQETQGGMQRLMRGVLTAYSRYFNDKYSRRGPLFESRYKASRLSGAPIIRQVSRYIHQVPKDWRTYPYTSVAYYIGDSEADWLSASRIRELFMSKQAYEQFVADTEAAERTFESFKEELAAF